MKYHSQFLARCLLIAMPLAATAQAGDDRTSWFQGVYAESDRAAAEGRGEWMLLLYATRGYRHFTGDGQGHGLQQSLAQWSALHEILPYGTEVRSTTTVDSVSFQATGAAAVVRGSIHFEMRYADLLSGGVESAYADSTFEDRWVREGSNWRLQEGQDLRPTMQIARAP